MTHPRRPLAALLGAALLVGGCAGTPGAANFDPKPATPATIKANQGMLEVVSRFNPADVEAASRGRIATMPDPVITDPTGRTVWDSRRWAFLNGDAPPTVNPSLWRLQKLNAEAGLFKVADGIYQFRGHDMANLVLVEGQTGWIAIDATTTEPVARAGLKLAMDTLKSTKPVVAVIYTHSHVDHFGGVRGLVDEADVRAGKVKIYAPDNFMQYAIAENVLAGNAMSRRGQFQFGMTLPPGPQGTVGTGLGLAISSGSPGLIPPTDYMTKTGQEAVIDGVRVVFQMAHHTEAPSEMMFYFPQRKALCVSEVANQVMHNVYTIRGAHTRDALRWSKVLNETLDLFPDAEVAFGPHHWPVQGRDNVRAWLSTQRDTYRFIHDRALHLANKGQTMTEIGNAGFFPKALAEQASSRGYYGTLSHNMRGVYNFYLGFYDANPATLDPLPRRESARRWVAALGGEAALLAAGRKAFAEGEYRWVVEMVNHAVFANPESAEARALQADALEQLGYQAEAATWRNAYLMGAAELRRGKVRLDATTANADTVRGMSNELLFDFIALRLDHEKTDGLKAAVQMEFTDLKEVWALELSNSVLNNTKGRVLKNPDLKLTLTRPAFLAMLLQGKKMPELVQAGMVRLEGDPRAFAAVVGSVVDFDPMFSVVSP
jgi:alkyl sulfatase BDS1-like metallo-beta-lactamase superfamily hydrolase